MLCGSTPYAQTEEGTEAFALSSRAQTTTGRSTVTTAFAETAQADPVVIFKRIIESKSGPPLSIPADAADFRVPKNKEIAEDLVRGLLRFYPSQYVMKMHVSCQLQKALTISLSVYCCQTHWSE